MASSKVVPSAGMTEEEARKARQKEEDEEEMQMAMAAGQNIVPAGVFVLDPTSNFCKNWDFLIILLMFFTALVTPFEVALMETAVFGDFYFLFLLNRLCDVGFITDMVINFYLGYLDTESNCYIYDRGRIAKHYLSGWFSLDLVSVLPYDMLGLFMKSDSLAQLKVLRVLRLLRLIKLLRVLRAARIFKRLENRLGISFIAKQLCTYLIMALMMIHWAACAWIIIPQLTSTRPTWMDAGEMSFKSGREMFDIYVAALEFSLMSMVLGYGSYPPTTTGERFVAVIIMLLAGSVYAYILGNVCQAVSSTDPGTTAFHQMMDLLNMYMEEIRLPKDDKVKAREYMNNCRGLQRQQYYQDVLRNMSPSMRGMFALHSHSSWIRKIPFFNAAKGDEKDRFTIAVALELERVAFTANELVFGQGEVADRMFIVQQGMVAREGQVLRKGNFFGHDMICAQGRRISSARALTFLDCQSLTREKLNAILDDGDFPLTRRAIHIEALRMAMKKYFKLLSNNMRNASLMMNKKQTKMSKEEIEAWVEKMTAIANVKHDDHRQSRSGSDDMELLDEEPEPEEAKVQAPTDPKAFLSTYKKQNESGGGAAAAGAGGGTTADLRKQVASLQSSFEASQNKSAARMGKLESMLQQILTMRRIQMDAPSEVTSNDDNLLVDSIVDMHL